MSTATTRTAAQPGPTTDPARTDGPFLSKADLDRAVEHLALHPQSGQQLHHFRRRLAASRPNVWSDHDWDPR
jgi:hypothetical protein